MKPVKYFSASFSDNSVEINQDYKANQNTLLRRSQAKTIIYKNSELTYINKNFNTGEHK